MRHHHSSVGAAGRDRRAVLGAADKRGKSGRESAGDDFSKPSPAPPSAQPVLLGKVNMLVARELARRRDEWQGSLIFSSVTDEEAYSQRARTLMRVASPPTPAL
jgi:hypothetical protein